MPQKEWTPQSYERVFAQEVGWEALNRTIPIFTRTAQILTTLHKGKPPFQIVLVTGGSLAGDKAPEKIERVMPDNPRVATILREFTRYHIPYKPEDVLRYMALPQYVHPTLFDNKYLDSRNYGCNTLITGGDWVDVDFWQRQFRGRTGQPIIHQSNHSFDDVDIFSEYLDKNHRSIVPSQQTDHLIATRHFYMHSIRVFHEIEMTPEGKIFLADVMFNIKLKDNFKINPSCGDLPEISLLWLWGTPQIEHTRETGFHLREKLTQWRQ